MGVPEGDMEGDSRGMVVYPLPGSKGDKVGGEDVDFLPNQARTKTPPMSELIKGRLMTCDLRLNHDWPVITVAVCYGSSVREERMLIEGEVSKIMDKPLLIGGDFNGITRIEESTGSSR